MQRWKVPVSFGSLQQNRCLGTNLNPVRRKKKKQAWHRRPQQRRCSVGNLAHTFQISHWLNKANLSRPSQAVGWWNHCDDCDARQLLHQTRDRNISAPLGAPFLPGWVCARTHGSREPELLPQPPTTPELHEPLSLWCHAQKRSLWVTTIWCS